MKSAYGILLMLLCNMAQGQGFISLGADSHPGINVSTGYQLPVGIQFTAGYSAPIRAHDPQIITVAVGKVVSFPKFEIIPSVGISRYKRDTIRNNDRFDGRILYPVTAGLEISRQVVFGNVHASINFCKGFYAGVGITGYFGDLKPSKKNFWQAEKRWYLPDGKEFMAYAIYSVGGAAKGVHDAMVFHHWGTGKFFGPDQWTNKWKGNPADKIEAFPGSSTVFVIFTDAVHSTNAVDVASIGAGTMINFGNIKEDLAQYPRGTRWLAFAAKKIIYPIIVRAASFELVWRHLKA